MMTLSNTDILFTAFDALMQADTVYNIVKTISDAEEKENLRIENIWAEKKEEPKKTEENASPKKKDEPEKTEEEKANVTALICTPENVMVSIEKSLDEVGMNNNIRINM